MSTDLSKFAIDLTKNYFKYRTVMDIVFRSIIL